MEKIMNEGNSDRNTLFANILQDSADIIKNVLDNKEQTSLEHIIESQEDEAVNVCITLDELLNKYDKARTDFIEKSKYYGQIDKTKIAKIQKDISNNVEICKQMEIEKNKLEVAKIHALRKLSKTEKALSRAKKCYSNNFALNVEISNITEKDYTGTINLEIKNKLYPITVTVNREDKKLIKFSTDSVLTPEEENEAMQKYENNLHALMVHVRQAVINRY